MEIIDAHQHFWQYDPQRHDWIDDAMTAIRQDFMPPQLADIFKQEGIAGCVAVQVDQNELENHFLIDLAKKYPFIKGIVGWVDLCSPQIVSHLERLSQHSDLCGFRHIVQGEADHNFLLRPDFKRGISQLAKYGFSYDILVFPHQLGAVLEFVKAFPNQRFVIDHLAKPYIKDGYFDGWALLMKEIAQHEQVYCKVSGMVTEADWGHWQTEDFRPYLDWIFECFGPNRIMYGSDWPVCLLAASYSSVKQIVGAYIGKLSEAEQAQVWAANAISFYGL